MVAAERACSADIQPNRPGPAKETVGIVLVVVPDNTGDVVDLETRGGTGVRGCMFSPGPEKGAMLALLKGQAWRG